MTGVHFGKRRYADIALPASDAIRDVAGHASLMQAVGLFVVAGRMAAAVYDANAGNAVADERQATVSEHFSSQHLTLRSSVP